MSSQSWTDVTYWFSLETFQELEFEREWLFYTALFSPLLVFIVYLFQSGTIYFAGYTLKTDRNPSYRISITTVLTAFPFLFISAAILLLGVALSGPFKSEEHSETWTEGIDIMLVMDVSLSMGFEDFKPNRLEQVKNVAHKFIEGRDSDKIGLIEFAGEAFSRAPLTTDYENLTKHINSVSLDDLRDAQGTAIGNALGLGVYRLENSDSESKVMILISDGDNTAGNIQPAYAAEQAKKAGIKVYTIGVGTYKKYITKKVGFFEQRIPIPPLNDGTLKDIAKVTGGQYFRASSSNGLEGIFTKINALETREIKENHYRTTTGYYHIYLHWGILALLAWLLLKATFITNGTID